jgi:hypothetical protein
VGEQADVPVADVQLLARRKSRTAETMPELRSLKGGSKAMLRDDGAIKVDSIVLKTP